MPEKYDAIIIGAGTFGLSTAYALTQQGKRVLVLDKGEVGSGASTGYARMSKRDPRNQKFNALVDRSQDIITKDLEESPGDILHKVLCFDVCEDGHPLRESYKGLIEDNPTKNPKERFGVTPEEGKSLFAYMEQTYTVNPTALLQALAKKSVEMGAEIKTQSAVKEWKKNAGGVSVVTESGEEYHADNIFIAAHGWSKGLMQKGNVAVYPKIVQSVATKRAPVWNFDWPEGVPHSIGRSSLPGTSYLDVYFLPEYLPEQGKWTMKVGLNSDRDRDTQYDSPDSIYTPELEITEEETQQAKALVEKKFGIKLGEPVTQGLCNMTYPDKVEGQGFATPVLGPLVDSGGNIIEGICAAYGGCGVLVKLSPAIGLLAAEGLETNWQGKKFDEFKPERFTPHRFIKENMAGYSPGPGGK